MSQRRKSHIKKLTFALVPIALIVMALVAGVSANNAKAMDGTQWDTVRGYINSYFGGVQYNAGNEGEAGFRINKTALVARLDSNNNISPKYPTPASSGTVPGPTTVTGVLGEGDDMATRPVLIDNLMTRTDVIPGTEFRCMWSTGDSCFSNTSITMVRELVDAHKAAGFSTDIVDYCVSAQTAGPTTGGFGIIAQVPGGLSSDTSLIPRVYTLDFARNGWRNFATALSGSGAIASPEASAGGFSAPATTTECDAAATDLELVRCRANWAISSTGGNVGNGTTVMADVSSAQQSVDIRPGTISTISTAGVNIQVPIDSLFTTSGLANLNPALSTILVSRTQMGADASIGLEMLGYPNVTNAANINGGITRWNSTQGEQQVVIGDNLPTQSIAAFGAAGKVDTTGPSVTSVAAENLTVNGADIHRIAGEPATLKVEYDTVSHAGGGSYAFVANNTVLNADKTVPLTGLTASTLYYFKATSYDGYANGTVSVEGSFTTAAPADANPPIVTNVLPSGNIFTESTTVSADYSDAESGINAASASLTLTGPGGPVSLTGCTQGAAQVSCSAAGLVVGAYTIGGSVSDVAGNSAPISGSFSVVDNVAPDTPVYTGPSGNININNPTITGTYNDPLPSSGIVEAQVSLDGATTFLDPNPCTISGGPSGTINCPVTGLADGAYQGAVRINDNLGNWINSLPAVNFRVDTIAPVLSNLQPSGWLTNDSPATMTVDLVETGSLINGSTVTLQIDGLSPPTCQVFADSISCDVSSMGPFSQGTHTTTAIATDNAGNTATLVSGSFDVDTVGPQFSNWQPTGVSPNTSQTLSVDYSDATSGINTSSVLVRLDSTPVAGCIVGTTNVSCDVTGLSSILHNVTVDVTDVAGNTAAVGWNFEVNTSAPDITDWNPKTYSNASPTHLDIAYASSGTVTAATITVDGTACDTTGFTQTAASCDVAGLADGNHDVVATVTAGGVEATKLWSFTRDTAAPSASNITPAGPTNNTSPTLEFDVSDGTGSGNNSALTVVNIFNGAGLSPFCTNVGGHFSCPLSGLTTGAYDVFIDTTDNAGNHSISSNLGQFTVDTTPPATTDNAPAGWQNFGTVSDTTLSCTDALSGCADTEYSVDGGGPQTGTVVPAPTTEGDHVITYRSSDLAGNWEGYKTAHVKLDLTPPASTDNAPAGWVNTDFNVTLSCTDASSGCSAIWYGVDGAPMAPGAGVIPINTEGDHTINYMAQDAAGNNEETHTVHARLDKTAPVASNVQPSGPQTSSAITITADLSDLAGGSGIDTNATHAYIDYPNTALTGCTTDATSISCPASLSGGPHVLTVIAQDSAGNTGTATSNVDLAQQNYYFTWYDNNPGNGMGHDWIMINNEGSAAADVYVYLGNIKDGDTPVASLTIPAGSQVPWESPTAFTGGPVRIKSDNGQPLMVSQRVIYKDSFNEVRAVEASELDSEYNFTWYDNASAGMVGDWVMVANTGPTTAADVKIKLHGVEMVNPATGTTDFSVPAGGVITPRFIGIRNGGVEVTCSNCTGDVRILASQRTVYMDSFNEITGIQTNKLSDEAMFTWYDNNVLRGFSHDWVMVTNAGGLTTNVNIYIGSATPAATVEVAAGESLHWQSILPRTNGPVRVTSDNGQPLIVSQRTLYKNSLNEVNGAYPTDLGSGARFNWYDNISPGIVGDWVLVGNSGADANVDMKIGADTAGSPYVASGGTTFGIYGAKGGPVDVKCNACSPGQKLVISQRLLYLDSFDEVLGKPQN